MQPIDKFSKLLELVQNDTVTPKEIEQFMLMVLEVIKNAKTSFESVSAENLQRIVDALSEIQDEHASLLLEVDNRASGLLKELKTQIQEVQKQIAEVQAIEVKDGVDGINADPAEAARLAVEMLPAIPDPDTGEEIVSKINDLPLDDPDFLIDAKHIKNLPMPKGMLAGGSRFINTMADVVVSSLANNDVLKWNSTRLRWENGAESGGGGGTLRSIVVTSGDTTAGATASTDYVYLVAGAHTITLPTAVSNANLYTVKNNHSAAIIVDTTSSQTIDGATSIQIAPEDSVDLISTGRIPRSLLRPYTE